MTSLSELTRDSSQESFEAAVHDAVLDGPGGEAQLVSVLDDLSEDRQVVVVAALGDAQGELGPAVLRRVLAGPGGSTDKRCVAALALAKRGGAAATPDLADALRGEDRAVADYAIMGLAGAGDDRAWEPAFAFLNQRLRARTRAPRLTLEFLAWQSDPVHAVCYLGRHTQSGERRVRLVHKLRENWDRLSSGEQTWLSDIWPGCGPEGPAESDVPAPDADQLELWIRNALFVPAD